jgi:hypothetical protein
VQSIKIDSLRKLRHPDTHPSSRPHLGHRKLWIGPLAAVAIFRQFSLEQVAPQHLRHCASKRFVETFQPYHVAVALTWPQFLAALLAVYLLVNVGFATLFWTQRGSSTARNSRREWRWHRCRGRRRRTPVLRLRGGDSLPPHIRKRVGTTAGERHNVILYSLRIPMMSAGHSD